LSLLFRAGTRPAAEAVARLGDEARDGAQVGGFSIVHDPGAEEGWLELLTSGLSYDLVGLAPGPAAEMPDAVHCYGLPSGFDSAGCEAITLLPGSHLAGGEHLTPVVRATAGLGARLSALAGTLAVCWHPARSLAEPAYFCRAVGSWLSGGAFPALGLTGLARGADGTVSSEGLAFLTGQELRLEPRRGEAPAEAAKLAIRLIHLLAEHGTLDAGTDLTGPAGESLWAEPSPDGALVLVRRTG
jgi:hypothetical protein